MHGAYIEDYNKYKDNWRFTQVLFLSTCCRTRLRCEIHERKYMEKTTKKSLLSVYLHIHLIPDMQEEIVEEIEQEDIQRNDDFITIMPKLITIEGCNQIIQQHFNLPFSEEVDL